jgi:beta-mannosidase
MVEGTLFVKLFDPINNEFVNEMTTNVSTPSGESMLITNLNEFKQFSREYILYAYLVDKKGKTITRSNDIVDIEKHMHFPGARVHMEIDGNVLLVETDRFARCIELTGRGEDGEFGWLFEDNYFDLLPGEKKQVKILAGKLRNAEISAKPYYSPHISKLNL